MTEHDYNVGRILKTVKEQGIAENTLIVWSSDNGPMYGFHPHGGYSMFDRGEKGQTWEGGVRVPAIAWWPGSIEAGQDPLDIVHVTDFYTTLVSIAGAKNRIPDDRVVDGVDQSALLLFGEDHGRRDYVFMYNYGRLESVRKDWVKLRLGKGVLPDLYDLMLDPAERHPHDTHYATYSFGLTRMDRAAQCTDQKYPHTVQNPHQREYDSPFDPSPQWGYQTSKQAEW